MLRVLAKMSCVAIILPLASSGNITATQYINTDVVKLPSRYEEITFRVTDGIPAKLGMFPYQVSLKRPDRGGGSYSSYCGGALISPQRILSAAHCFVRKGNYCQKLCKKGVPREISKDYAVAGILPRQAKYKKDGISSEQWRRIDKAITPRGFWFPKKDIAILVINKPFVFNKNVTALPYATKRMDYTHAKCVISGYGRVTSKKLSKVLLYNEVELTSGAKCSRLHGKNMRKFVCSESYSQSSDTQKGDSGGPLVCKETGDGNDKGDGVIVGVVSGGRRKNRRMQSFYTRVSEYKKFIRNGATKNLPVLNILWILLIRSNCVLYCV